MFRYIDMPKLVAFYLREFSVRSDGTPSNLYKFVFCLCLPFISSTFRRARLNALAIAECTNSADQISRVLEKITGATVYIEEKYKDFSVSYNETGEFDFSYNGDYNEPVIPYSVVINSGNIVITLNGTSKSLVESYLPLLIPFYIDINIIYR